MDKTFSKLLGGKEKRIIWPLKKAEKEGKRQKEREEKRDTRNNAGRNGKAMEEIKNRRHQEMMV